MKRVLIVNDQEISRKLIRLALTQIPDILIVGEAKNGLDAIEFVAQDQPDIVIMDFRMPFMDGLQATEKISKTWPDVKVILHSMTDISRNAGRAKGAYKVLRPFHSMKDLQTAVMNA